MHCPHLNELPIPPSKKIGWPWTEESSVLPDKMPNGDIWPKISIVTASYNQGQFIEETIRSILLQGYPNLEYIIVDGGSSDNSIEIIKKYENWLYYWVSEPDNGQSHALNKGFERATGEIFAWLNSDDYYQRDALRNIIIFRNNNLNFIAWVGACYDIDKTGKLLRKRFPRVGNKRQFGNWGEDKDAWIGQPACFFDAHTFKRINGIDERLNYVLDVDLWMRLADHGKFISTDQVLSFDRKYPEIKSYYDKPMQQAEHIFIAFNQGLPQVARKRMVECRDISLSSMSYKDICILFLKRSIRLIINNFKKVCNRLNV